MGNSANDLAAAVGQRLRSLRIKNGLSTRQLATAAGVSQPFLSQLENGLAAPSMITLYGLAQQLGVVPGALLPGSQDVDITVRRASEGALLPVADRPDAASGRGISMSQHGALEVLEYDINPGQYVEEWFTSEGETVIYVVCGAITVEIQDRPLVALGARDSISLPGERPHRILHGGEESARVLIIVDRTTFSLPRPAAGN